MISDSGQPNINIKINDKSFSGLLDARSNITIISKLLWPKSWPIQKISYQITEISQTKIQEVYLNIQIYPCVGSKDQSATLQTHMINAPLNLIKRFSYAMTNSNILSTFFLRATAHLTNNTIIKITWKNDKPIWTEQWTLTKEKLETTKKLIEFCQENALVIANTLFQQHKRRLYTWTSPDGQQRNQIDFILSSQRWRNTIQSAKRRPEADCGSDHELLFAKVRLKLKKVGKTTRPFRYDLSQIPYDYTVEVRNRFKGLDLINREPDELYTKVHDIVQ